MKGKSILLGVSGSIAAYKAAEVTRLLVKAEASVRVVMTKNAQRFITPLTLETLSGQSVLIDMFDLGSESLIGHIEAARSADLAILAPASASLIARAAAGIADDYLTTALLAMKAPVLVCPAMNTRMLEHPATRRNLEILKDFGCHILDSCEGSLACREEGKGRLADPETIVEAALRLLTPPTLQGKRVLVSAGPTHEHLDPARFLSNPSSGKMGFALAAAAARRSAEVHLVSGPSSLPDPLGVKTVRVRSAIEMYEAVMGLAKDMDAIVMSAAVGDYRPPSAALRKIKKTSEEMRITLVRNPDILAALGRAKPEGQVLAGFAAETEHLVENATDKLIRKNLDLIVANNLTQPGSGFGVDTNEVKIIDREGKIVEVPCMSKSDVAERIWDRIESLLARR